MDTLSLARTYADACTSKNAAAIHAAREAIVSVAQPSAELDQFLQAVAAFPDLPALVQTLAAKITLVAPQTTVTGNRNATATAPGAKSIYIEKAENVFTDGKDTRSEQERILQEYLDLTIQRLGSLPSFVKLAHKGNDARDTTRKAPTLAKVYVGLEVQGMNWRRGKIKNGMIEQGVPSSETRVPVLSEIAAQKQLVILGEPGAGKSTLVRHLCRAIAAQDEACLVEWKKLGPPSLPFLINLRDLARQMPAPSPSRQSEEDREREAVRQMWAFFENLWEKDGLKSMREILEKVLADKKSAGPIFFFDGLDEVRPEIRGRVAYRIRAWAARYPAARVIVTCRVRSYPEDAPWRLPWQQRTLQPFTLEEQVPQFVRGWYAELEATGWVTLRAEALAEDLLEAIRMRPELRELAPSPLLLTMMSLVHGREERLPPGKALLYDRLVDLLLWEWDDIRHKESGHGDSEGLPKLLSLTGNDHRQPATDSEVRRALAGLVFQQMQAWAASRKTRQRGTYDNPQEDEMLIEETALRDAFMPLHPGSVEERRAWAAEVVELIRQRSGLLLEVDDSHHFAFPHRTLAEFLCAFWLCEYQPDKPAAFGGLTKDLKDWGDWREVGLLSASFLARKAKTDQFLPWLTPLIPAKPSAKPVKTTPQVIIAAEMLLEAGERSVQSCELGRQQWQSTQATLRQIVEKGWLPPELRLFAGRALGRMGDDRPGVCDFQGIEKPDSPFWAARILPGPFPMGNDEAHGGYENERPRHTSTAITQSFAISRHLITVAQYDAFVKAGGYQQQRWWSEAGWKWVQREKITDPMSFGSPYDLPNHPQTGVSWHEATAFAAWLADREQLPIRLPTEAEWERAARHDDARTYPWGEKQPEKHANIDATGIGSPSAVGLFPSGRAECGAVDLSGNVWEWTASPWRETYSKPAYSKLADGTSACVLRGGAYYGFVDFARCAYRFRGHPHSRFFSIGFRVVASQF